VFLAGGITGVADWQAEARTALRSTSCVVLNPRRADFDVTDPNGAATQVAWECHHRKLRRLVMMFWFPACDPVVTVQPIALLELGAELARTPSAHRRLVVGADPGYPRRADIVLQCHHDAPQLSVHDTLDATLLATATAVRALAGLPS
jgi:hypothetical protein